GHRLEQASNLQALCLNVKRQQHHIIDQADKIGCQHRATSKTERVQTAEFSEAQGEPDCPTPQQNHNDRKQEAKFKANDGECLHENKTWIIDDESVLDE